MSPTGVKQPQLSLSFFGERVCVCVCELLNYAAMSGKPGGVARDGCTELLLMLRAKGCFFVIVVCVHHSLASVKFKCLGFAKMDEKQHN